jgi:hypothetical protein
MLPATLLGAGGALELTTTNPVRTFLRLAGRRTHLAQVAELVDALVSGTSGAIRGGSSPLLGTISITTSAFNYWRLARRMPVVVRNFSSATRTRSRPSFFAT